VKANPEVKAKPELVSTHVPLHFYRLTYRPSQTPEQLAEKEAKEAEKKAKEAEKQKRVEAQNKKAQEVAKSKAMMQSFFKKPAAAAPKKTQKLVSVRAVVDCDAGMYIHVHR
jgi:hypothetical protein